eukprot:TRINITY_DN1159_c0_g1_i2.p1 TRINITY_DN1159_c0_g1~~TRINITY_DN1159_c0_g1_i2.p1  ORF type:complete len:983 (-),score=217.70 TRINITY_DN1159_c0_g1_i2:2005-4953(-)
MSEEEREMIKDSIFHKLKNSRSGGIEAAVELQLLRIATFVVKKSVLDGDPDENRMKYLNDLDVLEWKNSPRLFVRFWFCMTEEFSVSKSRLSLGVPLRFHQSAAETFTSAFLPPLFQSCIDILSSTLEDEDFAKSDGGEMVSLTAKLLAEVLMWEAFNPSSTYFAPPVSWLHALRNSSIIELLWKAFDFLKRNKPNFRHLVHQCLVQFSSMRKVLVTGIGGDGIKSEEHTNFLLMLLQSGFSLVRMGSGMIDGAENPEGEDFIAGCQILNRMVGNIGPWIMFECPTHRHDILESLRDVTVSCMDVTGKLAVVLDEGWISEGLDLLLHMWSRFVGSLQSPHVQGMPLSDAPEKALETLVPLTNTIFETYFGYQIAVARHEAQAEEEGEDSSILEDRLMALATLAWLDVENSLNLVHNLLRTSIESLSHCPPGDMPLELLEDTYWSITLLGHIMTEGSDREVVEVPDEIRKLYFDPFGRTLPEDSLPIHIAKDVIHVVLVPCESPRVLESFFWFFGRWLDAYPTPVDIMSNLLRFMGQFLPVLSEVEMLTPIKRVLRSLHKAVNPDDLFFEPSFLSLFSTASSLPELQKALWKTAIKLVGSMSSREKADEALHQMFYGLETSFHETFDHPNFRSQSAIPHVQMSVLRELEKLRGMFIGITRDNFQSLFDFFQPFSHTLARLVDIFRHESMVCITVLKTVRDVVRGSALFANEFQQSILGSLVMKVLELYKQTHVTSKSGRAIVSLDTFVEEETSNDITSLVSILSSLATVRNADGQTVVLSGLTFILPMMTIEMLEFPALSGSLFELISSCIQNMAQQISEMDSELFETLLNIVQFGFRNVDPSISKNTFECAFELARYHYESIMAGGEGLRSQLEQNPSIFSSMLHNVLQTVFLEDLDSSVLNEAADALFALTLVEYDVFETIVHQLVESHRDTQVHDRIQEVLDGMFTSHGLQRTLEKSNLIQFHENIQQYLPAIHSLLRTK